MGADGLSLPAGLAGISPRLATHFLSPRRKKVSKERATPLSASLRYATGNLRCGLGAGNRSNSLRATLHRNFEARLCRAMGVAPNAVMRRRVAQGWADQGSRLFERSEFERDPAQSEQRSVPEAQRRDDAFGSPFFCLLFFGEAKKSEWPPGHPRPARLAQIKRGAGISPTVATAGIIR